MLINRRELLKGTALGTASLAFTPTFNQLKASEALINQPHRFIFIRKSNGTYLRSLVSLPFPKRKRKSTREEAFEVDLSKHELPDWLKGLDGHKENMTILHGISMCVSGGGHYSYSGCMGAFKAGRNVLSNIKRQRLTSNWPSSSPLHSILREMPCCPHGREIRTGIVSGYSAPAPQQRNYCYADPMTAYENYLSLSPTPAVDSDNALLDYLHEKESRRLGGLIGDERLKIHNQVDSLQATRDRNTKVIALGDKINQFLPKLDPVHAGGGQNATLPQKQAAYTDVIVAMLASGPTNVVTYTIDDLGTKITTLPENKEKTNIHAVGHGGGDPDGRAAYMRNVIKTHHMKQVHTLVTKLKSIPEGNGTMFDNTTIIYMPETGAGHHGPDNEAPMVLMTGKIQSSILPVATSVSPSMEPKATRR